MPELKKELISFMHHISPQTRSGLLNLSDGQIGRVVKAILRYFDTGREPRLDPGSWAVFEAIKRDITQSGEGDGK